MRDFVLPWLLSTVVGLVPTLRAGLQFDGHTISAISAMTVTAVGIAVTFVFLVTARRKLGLVRRLLLALAVAAAAAAVGLLLVLWFLSAIPPDNS